MSKRTLSITERLCELVASSALQFDESLVERATVPFIDTIGVLLAGAGEPSVKIALAVAQTQYCSPQAGIASVVRSATPLSCCGAALVNGVPAHALDYDDVASSVEGHPSALLVPTVLAVSEATGASGREALEAYLVGLHVAASVGAGFGTRVSYARGWHMTSVLGALGAAAAAARLWRLSAAQAQAAIGISGSMAAGSRANFGTMVKHLHVGLTSAQSILAVELAKRDFSANVEFIDAPLGFLALHAEGPVDEEAMARAAARPVGVDVAGIDLKLFPCCYHTHRMIDAALQARTELTRNGVDVPGDIESVRVTSAPGGTASLLYPFPETPTEAKFSAEYTVASAVLDGAVGAEAFTPDAVERPRVRDLMKRVEVVEREVPPVGPRNWTDSYAVVEVFVRGGHSVARRVDDARGSHFASVSLSDVREKFIECAGSYPSSLLSPDRAFTLISELREDPDVGTLLRRILLE